MVRDGQGSLGGETPLIIQFHPYPILKTHTQYNISLAHPNTLTSECVWYNWPIYLA